MLRTTTAFTRCNVQYARSRVLLETRAENTKANNIVRFDNVQKWKLSQPRPFDHTARGGINDKEHIYWVVAYSSDSEKLYTGLLPSRTNNVIAYECLTRAIMAREHVMSNTGCSISFLTVKSICLATLLEYCALNGLGVKFVD
jgi:hypothetical protein